MRHLGRIGIFVATIKKFLVNLKRQQPRLFEELSQEIRDRYLHKGEASAFAMVKPSESAKTLEIVGNDLFFLVEHFRSHDTIPTASSYQLMCVSSKNSVWSNRMQCSHRQQTDYHQGQ